MVLARRAVLASSPLLRQRVQLGGALLLSVVLPLLVRLSLGPEANLDDLASTTIGNALAVILGHVIFRSLTAYPGIGAGTFVLPAIGIAYASVGAVFLGLRLDYSRFLFVLGFAICASWYVATFLAAEQNKSLQVGVVPVGAVQSLMSVAGVNWHPLDRPVLEDFRSSNPIVADFRADLPAEWERFLADCALRGTLVFHYKHMLESLTGRVEIDHMSENTFGSLLPALIYVKIKNVLDVLAALLALLPLFPIFVITAVVIKLDSPGPVFFRQSRMGFRGQVFKVCKFRTMQHQDTRVLSKQEMRHAITLDDDPRITRVGKILRRTRIDELPQIFNILAGQMSWIGPRPEAEVLSRWYEAELPFYRYRHVLKPGISGWAQVNQGHVAEVDQVMDKLQYDFYYIKYFSPWLDALIIFKTIGTVFTGFGSK